MMLLNNLKKIPLLDRNTAIPLCFLGDNKSCIVTIKSTISCFIYICEFENSWLLEILCYQKNLLATAYVINNFWQVKLNITSEQNLKLCLLEKNNDYFRQLEPVFMT